VVGLKTLREVRQQQGRSLRDVAKAAGIAPGELSMIERGLRNTSVRKLRAICAALGLKDAVKLLDALVPDPKRPSSPA